MTVSGELIPPDSEAGATMRDDTVIDLLEGVVDLHVHAGPDRIPRRGDDHTLALELKDGGFLAAVHRHHWCDTVARAAAASESARFKLLGALVLNSATGGLSASAVESALTDGAALISLPTLSAGIFSRGYR